jgi:NAD(P)-dependent dehydrogenase (short-subunit alcohol dehydrogenase family)
VNAAVPELSLDLSGKVALVTGASSGLGVRFAKVLASCGARVALAARRRDRLEEHVAEIRAAGGEASAIQLDVTCADQLVAAVEQAERALGIVDILVNNAGAPDAQYATKMSTGLIDQVIATNVRGPFVLAREVARRLIGNKMSGRIVNIASMLAYDYSHPGGSLYAITKGAVVRMTEALAVEWARDGINVNAIAPGAFHSEMMAGMIERTGEFIDRFPRRRMGRPEQLDGALLYLVSPSSDFVTGMVLKVDDCQHPR